MATVDTNMIEYLFDDIDIDSDLAQYIRRFVLVKATTAEPFDQAFYPTPYVRMTSLVAGGASISIPDYGIVNEPIVPGPYFSGLIDGDNAYMHFQDSFTWTAIEFQAGAPYYLWGVDVAKYVNNTGPFNRVLGHEHKLPDELKHPCDRDRLITLQAEFIRECAENAIAPISYIDHAVKLIEQENGIIAIQDVIEQIDLPVSERQFARNFKKMVGFSPKQWSAVVQLGYANRLLESAENLSEIALKAGYYDEAHFINTFQRLIRSSPKYYLSAKYNHMLKYIFDTQKQ